MKTLLLPAVILGLMTSAFSHAAEKTVGTGPSFKGPLGLQLYSLRGEFIRNVPATLEKVRDYGFKYVELAGTYNLSAERFKQLLDQNGLVPVGGHFPYERLKNDLEAVVKEARQLDLKYAGCAWIDHENEFDERACREAIAVFNRAGKALAPHGIKFMYHIHGYEFRPYGNGAFLDLLMAETDPENVCFQMDVYWVVHPGRDPVELLRKYPGRWELMHIKDMRKGVKGDLTGRGDVTTNVPLGTGQMDWAAILKEAEKVGIKYYFLEDESPWVGDQIPKSLRYLEELTW
jgi:sugar phosphate isomerase/epimerase